MFLYENQKCPVCSKPFEKGDDIVTCPDCGTPHHRECYNDLGGCKNRSLHGTDFVYKRGEASTSKGRFRPTVSDIMFGDETDERKFEYYEPEETEDVSVDDTAEETEAPEQEITDGQESTDVSDEADAANETDGVKEEDMAAVVSVNTVKFLPKFRRKRMLNWNWSAFFFGPYYFFFRKMHIHGAIFAAVEYGFRLAITAAFLPAFVAAAEAMAEVKTFAEQYAAAMNFMADPQYPNFVTATMLIALALLVIHIVCGLLADGFYRKKVINVIKAVDEKISMGESFSIMGPLAAMETGMSQKDMRKLFLSRQGGVSTMAPLLAIITIQLLLNLLNI